MLRPLLIIISILLSYHLNAQKMFVGPELGMNLIQVQKQDIGNDYQLGSYAGLSFDYKFNDWLSLRTGAYFSQGKHAENTEDTSMLDLLAPLMNDTSLGISGIDMNTYTATSVRITQHFIQVPVQANFAWKGINLFLGGYVGFMVGAKQKSTIIEKTPFMEIIDVESLDPTGGLLSAFLPPAYDERFSESTDSDDYRKFDYGLKAGLGYQYEQVGFQAAYSFGIPDYRLQSEDSEVSRNQFFQFSVRYMLPIEGKTGSSSIR